METDMKQFASVILEDDNDQAFMLAVLLETVAGDVFNLKRAASRQEAIAALKAQRFDIALTDLNVAIRRASRLTAAFIWKRGHAVVILSATDDDGTGAASHS